MIRLFNTVPSGITVNVNVDVIVNVRAKVKCTRCTKKMVTLHAYSFKHTVKLPSKFKGVKFLSKIAAGTKPGPEVIKWARSVRKAYASFNKPKELIAVVKKNWETKQAFSDCYRVLDEKPDGLNLRDLDGVIALLQPPKDWQSKHAKDNNIDDSSLDPPGLCNILGDSTALRGKYCLCHDSKSMKEAGTNCALLDEIPAELRDGISFKDAKCLPVLCKEANPHRKLFKMDVTVPEDDTISDEDVQSFIDQVDSSLGQEDGAELVDITETDHGVTLGLAVPQNLESSLSNIKSVKSAGGHVYSASFDLRTKWYIFVLAAACVLLLAILAFLVVLFVKRVKDEKEAEDKKNDGDAYYVRA
jgi:hypothetical protein